MGVLTGETLPRPDDLNSRADPDVLYARSYLLIRMLVGIIGFVLPFIFIFGEMLFLRGVCTFGGRSVPTITRPCATYLWPLYA
jgi:hypothetical protein